MKTKISSLILVALLLGAVSFAFAVVPRYISYQGKLTNSSGTALDGTYSFTFKLYNDPTAGTLKWSETQPSVQVTGGLYSVILGTTTAGGVTGSFDESYWLEITVGSEKLIPRQLLTSSPYTLIASSIAVSAVGIPQINATGTPSITTALLGNGTWGTPTGAGDMQKTVEGLAIGQSTATLRTDFTAEVTSRTVGVWTNENVRVGTATLSYFAVNLPTATYSGVKVGTATIALGVAAANVQAGSLGSSVIASSIAVSAVGVQQMNATGTPSAIKFLRGDNQWMEATTLTLKGVLPTDVPAGYIFYLTTDDNVYIAATDIVAGVGTWRKVATAIVP